MALFFALSAEVEIEVIPVFLISGERFVALRLKLHADRVEQRRHDADDRNDVVGIGEDLVVHQQRDACIAVKRGGHAVRDGDDGNAGIAGQLRRAGRGLEIARHADGKENIALAQLGERVKLRTLYVQRKDIVANPAELQSHKGYKII